MPEIQDAGKVWMRGTFSPVFAVRVADKYFVPGKAEEQSIECWVDGNFLCVDLHDQRRKTRHARRFDLSLPAVTPASLFNGFDQTQHADVLVVTFQDKGVEEYSVQGKDYEDDSIGEMDSQTFWQRTKFSFYPPCR